MPHMGPSIKGAGFLGQSASSRNCVMTALDLVAIHLAFPTQGC